MSIREKRHKEYWKPEEPVVVQEDPKAAAAAAEEEAKKPKITIEVEGGAKWTTSMDIMLLISAKEERGFGIAGYFVSEDKTPPTTNSKWVVIPQSYPLATFYSTTIGYTLDPKDGMKTIYVWCRDGEWNVSTAAVVTILLTSYEFIKKWGQPGTGALEFTAPSAIAQGQDNSFYIVDTDNHRVQVFDKDFNFIRQLGEGRGKTDGKFYYPRGVATDASSGDVYVVDSGNNRIQKFSAKGNFIKQWGNVVKPVEEKKPGEMSYSDGNETTFSRGGDPSVELYDPLNAVVDKNGNLFVVDSGNHRIKKYDKEGTLLLAWGINGSLDGMLHYPSDIEVDDSQTVYVSDMGNNRIQKFDKEGKFIGKWGRKGTGDTNLKLPLGIAIDASGHLYVADSGNHRVHKFDKDGNFIDGFGLTGAGEGEFNAPVFVVTDKEGYIYVLDRTNATVQKFKYVPRPKEEQTNNKG
ncbi:MAG: 6-bladed beta-propeller [Deltaproteobacteria bacterium]|nr:6-bladed beta-propeller [Deltaproteobacteria bacterium]